jgi:16S rRNA (uracil1498-N3)-methyltransferase
LIVSRGGDAEVRLAQDVAPRREPPLTVSLFPALCKPERMDWLLQKATEIGVSRVLPFAAARSSVPPPSSKRLLRWRRIVLEACKQSGRACLPLLEFREGLPSPGTPGPLALLFEPGPGVEPLDAVCPSVPPESVWLGIGPESGFSAEEASEWAASGWLRVGLGPRTLRTETAALVALTLVLNRWGDLGNG